MSNTTLIVCEKTGRWALALRAAARGKLRLIEARALSQCSAALQAAPASLVALETTGDALRLVINFILREQDAFPAARFVTLLEPGLESASPLLREAGAAEVYCSPGEAPALFRMARRHLALAPPENGSLRNTIAARLPWHAWATSSFAAAARPPLS